MKKKRKKIETLVNFILDETGSMASCEEATISGFNEYVKSLNKQSNIKMSLTKFNSEKTEIVFTKKAIKDVPELTETNYQPYALTPLYDAIGKTVKAVGKDVSKKTKVLCVIMTDGEENASKEYTRLKIFKLIKSKEKEGNWTFVYLGANQDSWLVGNAIGLCINNVINYDPKKTRQTYDVLSRNTMAYASSADMTTKNMFSKDDEKETTVEKDLRKNGKIRRAIKRIR